MGSLLFTIQKQSELLESIENRSIFFYVLWLRTKYLQQLGSGWGEPEPVALEITRNM